MSPSGKAPGFGPGIRGFESLHPSQNKYTSYVYKLTRVFIFLRSGMFIGIINILTIYNIF